MERWGRRGGDETAEEGGCESQIQEANSIYLKCREKDRGRVEGGMYEQLIRQQKAEGGRGWKMSVRLSTHD